jgi:hypothetical protein
MQFLQNLVSPFGAGAVIGYVLLVVLAGVWMRAVVRLQHGPCWPIDISLCSSAGAVIGSVYCVVLVPFMVWEGNSPDKYRELYVHVSGFGLVSLVASVCAFFPAVYALRRLQWWPWRMPFVVLSMAMCGVLVHMFLVHAAHAYTYRSWSTAGHGRELWVPESFMAAYLFLLGSVCATVWSFVHTGLQIPEVRAKWSRRLDWALHAMSYSGWSAMPFGVPYIGLYVDPREQTPRRELPDSDDEQ